MRRFLPLLAVGCALSPTSLAAQQALVTQPLDSARIVRLQFVDGRKVQARLVAPFTPDSGAFHYCLFKAPPCGREPERPILVVPATTVQSVELRVGSRAGRGFLIGGVIAGTLTLAWSAIYGDLCECRVNGGAVGLTFLVNIAFWGGVGALIGSGSSVWGPAP